jgi:hypothetical protein
VVEKVWQIERRLKEEVTMVGGKGKLLNKICKSLKSKWSGKS